MSSIINRKSFTAGMVVSVLAISGCGEGGGTDEYPSQDITMIVPYGAGANIDSQARSVVPCIEEEWDASIVLEFQPGSSGTIGTREIATAEPDGYTLGITNVAPAVLGPRIMDDDVGYTTDDLHFFGFLSVAPMLVSVGPDSDFESLEEVVEASRNQRVVAAAPGANSIQAVLVDQLNTNYDAQIEVVPTDETNEIIRGVGEGDYDIGVTTTSMDMLPLIESGDLTLLARGLGDEYEFFEGVPTYEEAGYPDLLPETTTTFPLVGPDGIPDDVAEEIESVFRDCMEREDVREGVGLELVAPTFVSGDEVEQEYAALTEIIEELYDVEE